MSRKSHVDLFLLALIVDLAALVKLPHRCSNFLVAEDIDVDVPSEFLQSDRSVFVAGLALEFSECLEDDGFLLLGCCFAGCHGSLDNAFDFTLILVDVDLRHFLHQTRSLLVHLSLLDWLDLGHFSSLGVLLGSWSAAVVGLFILLLSKVGWIIQAKSLQHLTKSIIECVAVTMKAVDHQSEGFDAILDLNFLGLVQFGMGCAETNQRLKGTDGDGKNSIVCNRPIVVVLLSEKCPQIGEQVNSAVSKLRVHVMLAVRDVPP